jgi:methylated-DNA-[protein]-cysteine S-methyltransferase
MLEIRFMSVATNIGRVWLWSTPRGIFYVNLGDVDSDALRAQFAGRGDVTIDEGGPLARKMAREVTQYFEGRLRKFSVPLDLRGWSPFAKRVWRATSRIPFGQTKTYGWLADRVGGPNFARAVGGALSSNPIPLIVPCHRVVGAHGDLGGFTGELWIKRWLLDFEAGCQVLPLT